MADGRPDDAGGAADHRRHADRGGRAPVRVRVLERLLRELPSPVRHDPSGVRGTGAGGPRPPALLALIHPGTHHRVGSATELVGSSTLSRAEAPYDRSVRTCLPNFWIASGDPTPPSSKEPHAARFRAPERPPRIHPPRRRHRHRSRPRRMFGRHRRHRIDDGIDRRRRHRTRPR
ncbi:hypothetical protein PLANTIT3_61135 [Plantibacter sp. T3]|nr:hypothetical protein PLANTIT3_61135 [Plantibacter sp. T3]